MNVYCDAPELLEQMLHLSLASQMLRAGDEEAGYVVWPSQLFALTSQRTAFSSIHPVARVLRRHRSLMALVSSAAGSALAPLFLVPPCETKVAVQVAATVSIVEAHLVDLPVTFGVPAVAVLPLAAAPAGAAAAVGQLPPAVPPSVPVAVTVVVTWVAVVAAGSTLVVVATAEEAESMALYGNACILVVVAVVVAVHLPAPAPASAVVAAHLAAPAPVAALASVVVAASSSVAALPVQLEQQQLWPIFLCAAGGVASHAEAFLLQLEPSPLPFPQPHEVAAPQPQPAQHLHHAVQPLALRLRQLGGALGLVGTA